MEFEDLDYSDTATDDVYDDWQNTSLDTDYSDFDEMYMSDTYYGMSPDDVSSYGAYDGFGDISSNIEIHENILGEDIAIITGRPFDDLEKLDYQQGDNSYNAGGCCGLVSSSNFLNLCGVDTNEDEVVGFAMENDLCANGFFLPWESRGGTGDVQIEAVIENYGIEVTAYDVNNGGSIDDIANAIDEGRVVTIGVNAGYLYDDPSVVDQGQANHQITVTGAVRDTDGEVIGLVICDSGRWLESDACRVVPREQLERCYQSVPGASAIITDNPVR